MLRALPWCVCIGLLGAPPGALVRSKVAGTNQYLNVPPGFQISLFAQVSGARFMAVAPNGDVFVSQPGAGRVILLRPDANGGTPRSTVFASGLHNPHDIVFDTDGGTGYVYIAESNQVGRYRYSAGDTSAHDREVVVANLPDASTPELRGAYAHELKNIALDSQHHLYVSIASSCNVCASDTTSNPVRAAIYRYDANGANGRLYARGIRNAEGLRFLPGTDSLWVVINNRDDLPYPVKDSTGDYGRVMPSYVDDHPPDLFTAVRDGGNYGWPFCNSNPDAGYERMPFEPDYDTNRSAAVDCSQMDTPTKGIQAHSAPLGLSFLQDTRFAPPYRQGAVIGAHGSWNRTRKTGYKVIYFPFSATQTPGAQVDLVTGWLDDTTQVAWGRPVQAVADATGSLLISDDQAGAIYRTTYTPAAVSAASGIAWLAPESYGSIFASNPGTPDVSVTVNDSAGVSRQARVSYASTAQINFVVPQGTASGNATVSIAGTSVPGIVWINSVAPALFSANGTGSGPAAATAVRRVIPTNIESAVPVFQCAGDGNCKTVPIQLGVDTPVYLSLYGTGIRGRSSLDNVKVTIGGIDVPLLFAGPQGTYPGLDQVNVPLVLSLRGAGEVDVVVTVDGLASNAVRIAIE